MGFSVGGLTGSNSSAKKAAELSFAYQKKILQNQHQWEAEDLEKAGYNPALTLGDSALSGNHASAPMPNMGGGQDALGGLINSAISMFTAKKQAETGDTQGQLNLAQAENIIAQTKEMPENLKNRTMQAVSNMITANANKMNAQTNSATAKERINTEIQERFLKREQELGQRIANNRASIEEKKEYVRLQRYINRGKHGGSAGDVNDIVRTMRGSL